MEFDFMVRALFAARIACALARLRARNHVRRYKQGVLFESAVACGDVACRAHRVGGITTGVGSYPLGGWRRRRSQLNRGYLFATSPLRQVQSGWARAQGGAQPRPRALQSAAWRRGRQVRGDPNLYSTRQRPRRHLHEEAEEKAL